MKSNPQLLSIHWWMKFSHPLAQKGKGGLFFFFLHHILSHSQHLLRHFLFIFNREFLQNHLKLTSLHWTLMWLHTVKQQDAVKRDCILTPRCIYVHILCNITYFTDYICDNRRVEAFQKPKLTITGAFFWCLISFGVKCVALAKGFRPNRRAGLQEE